MSATSRFTTAALCREIFERHQDTIGVRKPHVAVAKLARILEAALDLSNRRGFDAMSLRELATRAGISMGGLYAYFDTKETLLVVVLEQVSLTATRELSNVPPDLDPKAHLLWLIDTHIRMTEAMQAWFVFAFMEAKTFPPGARRLAVDSEMATESRFEDAIERGRAAGVFETGDARMAAALVKPLLQDWYVKRAKYRKRGVSVDAYIATVSDFVLRALEARPERSA